MMNKSRSTKRILALILALITLLPCAPALAESYSAILTKDAAVYADANFSRKIADLEAYTLVTVKAVAQNVAQVKYKGYTVYTGANVLKAVDDIAVPGVVTESTYVFESPDLLSRSVSVKAGTTLNVLAIKGDWAMVEKDGYLGYAYTDHLTPAASNDGDKDENSGTDPFLPDSDSPSTAEPADDESNTDGVTIETVAAQVASATMPVYKSASASSQKLGTLKYGQKVTVYAYNAEWAYIGLNGKYGYCALKNLEKVSSSEPEESDQPAIDLSKAIPATVTADSVKVYKSASTSSDTLGTLKKGVQVNVIKTSGAWACIELNGKLGYCALAALTKTSELEAEDPDPSDDAVIGDKSPLGTATVIQASAPVYSSMSAANPSSTLQMGETLNYYGYDSKWVLVGRDGNFGFVPRNYLNAESYAELETDDTGDGVKKLENALLALGYLDSVPGTTYTAYTADAVSRLQAACSMNQTGAADTATLRVLYSENAPVSPMLSISLSKGDRGDNVKRLQNRLLALGYLSRSSSVDGDYGSTTLSAVKLFQTACGASATGAADTATIRALYNAAAPTLPSGATAADAASASSGGSSSNSTDIGNGLGSTTDKYVPGMSNAQKLEYVIYVAQQQLGKRYVFGAAGTATFDCSGLTMYCFKQVGVTLAHSAYTEGYNNNRQKISSASSLRRGDLVFFNTVSDGDQCDHVGIYLGNNYFIHASSGAGKVVVSNMGSGYYNRVFSWGRRVLDT